MGRVSVLVVSLVALVGATATTGPQAVTSSTVVGEESCDGSDLVAAEHDACAWTMTTTTEAGAPPVLEVRVTTADSGDEVADGAVVVWSSGDCAFHLDHDSGTGVDQLAPPETLLHVGCGEAERHCTVDVLGQTGDCEWVHEEETQVTLDLGARDGTDLVWTLTFDGDLSEWAGLHDRGSVLVGGTTSVGPRAPGAYPFAGFTCGTDTPCVDFGGDFIFGTREHVVR